MQHIDIKALCERVGGSRPIHPSTAYRLVKRGLLPKPIRIFGSSRWIEAEVEVALAEMMEARNG
jgi:predicted DNA-binding transcriptional regulator AlpA